MYAHLKRFGKSSNQNKLYTDGLICLFRVRNLCFVFVQQIFCELWALICNAVKIKLIVVDFTLKQQSMFFVHMEKYKESTIP